ncbi:hypothetical protein LDL77_08600 [Flagellimonas marinaquae]|uniref:DUF4919 domain-containing protein n=1 Tax=Flagellimonas aurea TaxID=2915619 RepID=A0ABS3G034_9FLAO|nr:hypothetical protein [Allomuricauda aurea]MAO16552.1 hypothetical protein [Allomuricauda sp.]MBO0352755.1 hypothetical protein [Allomuricauda aurea]UBZ15762.1 hypothetical protein LDL77_08600 [Allomuricauda aquimarina]|tara:strand:+ start:680 stop:1360 length:681 start_codon:yes stop_codon:yes gene_type:complete
MKKILALILLISSFANAQSFKELYAENFKSDWEVYQNEEYVKQYIDTTIVYKLDSGRTPEQELLFQAKQNHDKRAELISEILSSLKLNFEELDSLAFIEQGSTNVNPPFDFVKKGAIITKDSVFGFLYNLERENVEIARHNYFQNSESEIINQAKQVIGNLIISAKTNYLDTIARVESKMLSGPLQALRPETEFEILIYNKNENSELKRIYLHDTFIQIMNQKQQP